MKHIFNTLFLLLVIATSTIANPFEVKLVVNDADNTLAVLLRNTTSNQPTTSQNITSINMRLLGQVSDIISVASTNYTMQMPTTVSPNTQVITMSSTALPSPEDWIQDQWVTVAVYNLTPGTYNANSFSIQSDLDGDNSDVQDPIMSVAAAGVFNTPLTLSATILPVELGDFEVKQEKGNAKLTWTTYSERSNEGFNVEKSEDGKNFNSIGWVDGNGTSNRLITYTFLDENYNQKTSYYRLKQMDHNGDFAYSVIRSLDGSVRSHEYSLFPNPAYTNTLNVLGTGDEQFTVKIFSTEGKKMLEETGLSTQIDCSNLNSGLYLVHISQGAKTKVINWIKK
ncbi:T9SS type A sorting domain-containing protein [Portibacter lacus]|nr:T9SS type A sorting domain-containing protein [Portibacter lacus]